MDEFIPYGKHYVDQDDIDAVIKVLKGGWLTQGPKIAEFEKKIADKVNAKYAIAVSSASAGLHLASLALNIGKEDVVLTSPNTFVASSNCILYLQGTPKFIDIDGNSLNICPKNLSKYLEADKEKIKTIIPVHFAGAPCEMEDISGLAKSKDISIIEDASHALGGKYSCGSPIGSCKYSEMTVFSLHPVKGVTAGEGGIVTTNKKSLADSIRKNRSHGIYKGNFDFPGVSQADENIVNKDEAFYDEGLNPWYYEMQTLGFNYRITDIQCALALSQMNKLENFIYKRSEIVSIYDERFAKSKFIKPTQTKYRNTSAHHLYVVKINFNELGITRGKLMRDFLDINIGTQVHYIPVPLQPYYQKLGYKLEDYPQCMEYYNQALSLPVYYGLKSETVNKICDLFLKYENKK